MSVRVMQVLQVYDLESALGSELFLTLPAAHKQLKSGNFRIQWAFFNGISISSVHG